MTAPDLNPDIQNMFYQNALAEFRRGYDPVFKKAEVQEESVKNKIESVYGNQMFNKIELKEEPVKTKREPIYGVGFKKRKVAETIEYD